MNVPPVRLGTTRDRTLLAVLVVVLVVLIQAPFSLTSSEDGSQGAGSGGDSLEQAPALSRARPLGKAVIVWAVGDTCDNDNEEIDCAEVGALIARDKEADLFIQLGDAQYDNGELANFRKYYDPKMGAGPRLKKRTFPIPGNHEYLTTDASGYFTYFGALAGDPDKGYQATRLGRWTIIGTNTNCSKAGGCDAGSPQGDFIARQLARAPRCEIVAGHHPAITDGQYAPSEYTGKIIFDRAVEGGAELYLSGHDHNYQRFAPRNKALKRDPAGVRQIVSGAGGQNIVPFEGANRSQARQDKVFGAVRIRLRDGRYTGSYVNIRGRVMDRFRGSCR